jgi:predicted Rossmann fold nucleotide-binding protein DprA/Smf involved in DNA uptake
MLGALEREGTVVGVLADSLLRSATSVRYRKHLMANDLVLVSPFNPEAGFNVGNAMSRNSCIYCLASSGSADLVQRGAKWLPNDRTDLSVLFTPQDRGFDASASCRELPFAEPKAPVTSDEQVLKEPAIEPKPMMLSSGAEPNQNETSASTRISLDELSCYEFFLHRMAKLTAGAPLGSDDLLQHLDVSKAQLNAWLKRAVADRRLKKLKRPVRYRVQSLEPEQTSMFDRG